MKNSNLHELIKSVPKTKTKKILDDLQYNLTAFLNEDVYMDHFEDLDSLYWINFFKTNNLIYITKEENRVLLTPTGITVLNEINSLLLYLD